MVFVLCLFIVAGSAVRTENRTEQNRLNRFYPVRFWFWFSSGLDLPVQFLVLQKRWENRTELNFGNTIQQEKDVKKAKKDAKEQQAAQEEAAESELEDYRSQQKTKARNDEKVFPRQQPSGGALLHGIELVIF